MLKSAAFGNVTVVEELFLGLKAALVAVVVRAVSDRRQGALTRRLIVGIAAAAFIAIFFFRVSFPLIMLAGGIFGYIGGRFGSPLFRVGCGHKREPGPILRDERRL